MCLIVECPEGRELPLKVWQNFARRNDDGAGFVWWNKDGVRSARMFVGNGMEAKPVYDLHKQLARDKVKHFVHLRMATHGTLCKDNVHPFKVLPGLFLMHNGVIGREYGNSYGMYGEVEYDWLGYGGNIKAAPSAPAIPVDPRSDTALYVDSILQPMLKGRTDLPEYLRSKEFDALLNNTAGIGNRIALFDNQGPILFQRHSWHTITKKELKEAEDILVSNTYAWDDERPKVQYSSPVTYDKGPVGNPTLPVSVKDYCGDGDPMAYDKHEQYMEDMSIWWASLQPAELLAEITDDPAVAARVVEYLLEELYA
jgi:hypothetical protein